ncbi:hypothetical protein [Pseudophaeobacter sp.]|jgi:hypothetical protein|uniref:hypothetical protein n=1 Tax=Pseudophaeobacter sp. TaxID=1971739 RepID=UPI0032D8B8EF
MKPIFVALAAITLTSACAGIPTITHTERLTLSNTQINTIKQTAARGLKDPDSAKFRNIRKLKNSYSDGTAATLVCGEVNAKNSYGAYVGYMNFRGGMTGDRFRLDAMATPSTNQYFSLTCGY